jgi:hypothetical protein
VTRDPRCPAPTPAERAKRRGCRLFALVIGGAIALEGAGLWFLYLM